MPEVERGGRRLKKKDNFQSLLIPSESRKEHLLPSFFSCQVTFEGCLVSSKQFLRSAELILLPCWQTSEVREGAILHCSHIWWDAPAYGCCSISASRSTAPKHKTRLEPSSSMAWGKNCKRRAARDRAKEEVIVLKHQLCWRQYLSWLNRAGFDVLHRHKSAAFTISSSCWYLEVRGIS